MLPLNIRKIRILWFSSFHSNHAEALAEMSTENLFAIPHPWSALIQAVVSYFA
jgi:hypothetical protein